MRKDENERRRVRYATDSEYRERVRRIDRKSRQKQLAARHADPVWQEQQRLRQQARAERERQKREREWERDLKRQQRAKPKLTKRQQAQRQASLSSLRAYIKQFILPQETIP